jgi:hypothetical protein
MGAKRPQMETNQLAKSRCFVDFMPMPRYFFNVVEDNHKIDVIGAEYPDAETARMEAVRFAADLLKAEPERVWKGAELRIEAADTWETLLFTIIIVGVDAEALAQHRF